MSFDVTKEIIILPISVFVLEVNKLLFPFELFYGLLILVSHSLMIDI